MMFGQKCKEENSKNGALLVHNGKLTMNTFLQRCQIDNHALQHNTNLFHEYISFLQTSTMDWEDCEKNKIIQILKQRFEKADPWYLSSEKFEHLVLSTTENMKKDMNRSFVYIQDLSIELKSYKLKKRASAHMDISVLHKDSASSPNSKKLLSVRNNIESSSSPCSSSVITARSSSPEIICVDDENELSTENSFAFSRHSQSDFKGSQLDGHNHHETEKDSGCVNDTVMSAKDVCMSSADENAQLATASNRIKDEMTEETPDANSMGSSANSHDKMKHVQKLEKLMKRIDKKIKKLQKKELTLEDMDEESDYILEDKLKKKFVKVWEEWCKQVGRSSRAGYQTQKPFHYKGSRYISINAAVEKFLNKKRIFPDFCDILDVVTAENIKSNLCLKETQCHNIARDIFSDVGKTLKERRCRDYINLAGCYLTDDVNLGDDPADHDDKLRLELDNNKKASETRLDEILESYVQKQEEKSGLQEEASTSPDENSDEDEELSSKLNGEVSSCSSGERSPDELSADSVKKKKGSLISENMTTKASMKKNLCISDAETKSMSDVACTSSPNMVNSSGNACEVLALQSLKHANGAPKQAAEFRNVIQTKISLSSVSSKKTTSSVYQSSPSTSSQISKYSNWRTITEVKANAHACNKGSELKHKNFVTTLTPQNDCKSSVDTATEKRDNKQSTADCAKMSMFGTAHQNSGQNSVRSSCCIKTKNHPVSFSKEMSRDASNVASEEAEEIWIGSSSDSDVSTEPTSSSKPKSLPKSCFSNKSIPHQPFSSATGTPKKVGESDNHQSCNSNKPNALKGMKRISTVPVQSSDCIPDKKLCLSSVSKC